MSQSVRPKIDKNEIDELISYFRSTDYAHANNEIYAKNKRRFKELVDGIIRECGAKEADIQNRSFTFLAEIKPLPEEKEQEQDFKDKDPISRNFHIAYQNLLQSQKNPILIDRPDMQVLIGLIQEMGLFGIKENAAQAVTWYRKAADQGYARAQHFLGWMYELGRGVALNYKEAVIWYRKSAEQEDAKAKQALERMANEGRGNAAYHLAVVNKNIDGLVSILNQNSELFRETFRKHDAPRIAECDWLQALFFRLLEKEKDHMGDHKMDWLVFILHLTPQMDTEWLCGVDIDQLDDSSRDMYVVELHGRWLSLSAAGNAADPDLENIVARLAGLYRQNLLSEDNKLLFSHMLIFSLFAGLYEPTLAFERLNASQIEILYALYRLRLSGDELMDAESMIALAASGFLAKEMIIPREQKEEFSIGTIKTAIQDRRRQMVSAVTTKNHLPSKIEAIAQSFEKSNPKFKALASYLRHRAKEESAEYTNPFGFFSAWFGGYSKTEKVEAVTLLMRKIMGENVELTEKHKKVLAQGKLGKLYAAPDVQEAIQSVSVKHNR